MTMDSNVHCLACGGACALACFNDAVIADAGGYRINGVQCAGCGACVSACRWNLIELDMGVAYIRVRS
jgi:Fe-S-cluster-containing hydrogenase component 2